MTTEFPNQLYCVSSRKLHRPRIRPNGNILYIIRFRWKGGRVGGNQRRSVPLTFHME